MASTDLSVTENVGKLFLKKVAAPRRIIDCDFQQKKSNCSL